MLPEDIPDGGYAMPEKSRDGADQIGCWDGSLLVVELEEERYEMSLAALKDPLQETGVLLPLFF